MDTATLLHVPPEADVQEVLGKGWGAPHLLAGRGAPSGLVLIFAPRDAGEVETCLRILDAARRFVSE